MTPYLWIAALVALVVSVEVPERSSGRSIVSGVVVGLLWPVLPVMGLYFGIKVWGLGLPLTKDPDLLNMEIYGCLAVTIAGIALYLRWSEDPFIMGLLAGR